MPRLSARTRLIIAVLAISTVVGLVAAKVNTSGNLHLGAAATRVMIDDPDASIVDRRAIRQDVGELQQRAELYARIMVSTPVLEAIARRAHVPPDEVAGVARSSGLPFPLTQPGSEERANQIHDSRAPYRLELQADPDQPILSVYTEAPSAELAARLADAAILGLQDYLRGIAQQQRFPENELPQLRQLGNANGAPVNTRAPLVVGGLTFITAFALTLVALLVLMRVRRRRAGLDDASAPPEPIDERRGTGDWPRTTRVLPWTIAAFITMLWLTPFDKLQVAISTPIDLKLDRLVLPFVVAVWLLAFAAGGSVAPKLRLSKVHVAVGAFLAVAFLSVVLDARYLNQTGELDLALKKLPLLVSYMSIFVIVASSIRRTEVPALMTYTLILAVICGLGVVIEYRLNQNVFNLWSQKLFPHPLFKWVADGNGDAVDSLGRRWITGPAGFGVETVGMMAMAVPIAVVGLLGTKQRGRQALYALALVVLFAAMFATQRKSALVAPVAVMATLAYFRRRELLSLAPLGLVMAVMVAALSPGAVHGVIAQFTRSDSSHVATVSDRTSDYDAIRPDLWTHFLFGRGFGTYAHDTYRVLDSEILNRIVETGILGLVAFVLIAVSVVFAARKTIAERDPTAAPYALCGTAAAVCFLVLATLFDELGYPHGAYIFLYIAGLVVVVVGPRAAPEAREPRERPLRTRYARPRPVVGVVRQRMIRTR
jgi:O-antigen ligase